VPAPTRVRCARSRLRRGIPLGGLLRMQQPNWRRLAPGTPIQLAESTLAVAPDCTGAELAALLGPLASRTRPVDGWERGTVAPSAKRPVTIASGWPAQPALTTFRPSGHSAGGGKPWPEAQRRAVA